MSIFNYRAPGNGQKRDSEIRDQKKEPSKTKTSKLRKEWEIKCYSIELMNAGLSFRVESYCV